MPYQIENKMVVDAAWLSFATSSKSSNRGAEVGYREINTHAFVPDCEAYEYAINQCLNGTESEKNEFKKMLVEWFFSGDWRKEE